MIYTQQSLYAMIAEEQRRRPTDASVVQRIYDRLTKHGNKAALWLAVGRFALEQIESRGRRGYYGSAIVSSAAPKGRLHPVVATSLLYDSAVVDPWDISFPVWGTYTRKPLRDWTATDFLSSADWFDGQARGNARKAQALRQIAAARKEHSLLKLTDNRLLSKIAFVFDIKFETKQARKKVA